MTLDNDCPMCPSQKQDCDRASSFVMGIVVGLACAIERESGMDRFMHTLCDRCGPKFIVELRYAYSGLSKLRDLMKREAS